VTLSGAASDEIGAPVVIEFLYSVYGSPGASLILVYRGRVDPLAESSDGLETFQGRQRGGVSTKPATSMAYGAASS
jgi:hypothetical protein